MPKTRVRMATIFAPSRRKRCSTMPDTSAGCWTMFFKARPPGNDSGTRTLFSTIADPLGDFIVGCTGGNEGPKIIVIDLGKFQPALIERTVGMVLPFPAYKDCATFVHGARRQHVVSQRLTRTSWKFFAIA